MTRIGSLCFLVVAMLGGGSVTAQEPKPRFAVVSIKPQPAPFDSAFLQTAGTRVLPGGVFSTTHVTVEALIMFAHRLPREWIIGGPSWMRETYFQIEARADGEASSAQLQRMMESLLQERFQLVVHRERREVRFDALVWRHADRQAGPYLHKVKDCSVAERDRVIKALPSRPTGGRRMSGCAVGGFSLLGSLINVELGSVVEDLTGTTDPYFYEVRYAQPTARDSDPSLPPLRIALEDQLGLKVEPRREVREMLVIDSVSQPTEN